MSCSGRCFCSGYQSFQVLFWCTGGGSACTFGLRSACDLAVWYSLPHFTQASHIRSRSSCALLFILLHLLRPMQSSVSDCITNISHLLAGRAYVDPGATATDNVDGNITSRLSTFGLGAVDTTAPNNASDPFFITYDVSDSAGNAAVRGLRGVLVVCRPPRVLCTTGDGTLYCSTSTGLCIQLTPTSAGGTAAVAPTIKLVGQAVLGVPLGSSYLACPTPQPTSVVCDRSDSGSSRGSCVFGLRHYCSACRLCFIAAMLCLFVCHLCRPSTPVPSVYA